MVQRDRRFEFMIPLFSSSFCEDSMVQHHSFHHYPVIYCVCGTVRQHIYGDGSIGLFSDEPKPS